MPPGIACRLVFLSIFEAWNLLRHCNLPRGFVPLKSLQKIEMAVGNMLHRLIIHCTKLVPDSFLDDVVQCRCFVTE